MALTRSLSHKSSPAAIGASFDAGRLQMPTVGPERMVFDKAVLEHMQKATDKHETPAKEKHVRFVILASFKDRGATAFWNGASRLALQGEQVICWKFVYMLHKTLRDGHPKCIAESQPYCSRIVEIGKLWGHVREGYAQPIRAYSTVISKKISFHRKYPTLPGSLVISDAQLDGITHDDPNAYFEICIDMFEYQEILLALADTVFDALDRGHATSAMLRAQCLLLPLVLVIQETALLYDYLVKFLYRLHSECPPDSLQEHRQRFGRMFQKLKAFYARSAKPHYFRNLVQIPTLPDEPPNFLDAAGLSRHQRLKVVVAEPEPEYDDDTDVNLSVVEPPPPPPPPVAVPVPLPPPTASLVDTSEPPQRNGFDADDRDMLIKRLLAEIERLKGEIQRIIAQAKMRIDQLSDKIDAQELEIEKLRSALEYKQKEIDELLRLKEQYSGPTVQALNGKVKELEKQIENEREKLNKLKDVYLSLRDEHVKLLRGNVDSKQQSSEMDRLRSELNARQMQMMALQEQLQAAEDRARNAEHIGVKLKTDLEAFRTQVSDAHNRSAEGERKLETFRAAQGELVRSLIGKILSVMSGSVGTNVKNKLNEFESVGTGGGPAESSAASTDAAIDSLLQLVANLRSTIDSIGLFRNRSNSPLSELNADDVGQAIQMLLDLNDRILQMLNDSKYLRLQSVEDTDQMTSQLRKLSEDILRYVQLFTSMQGAQQSPENEARWSAVANALRDQFEALLLRLHKLKPELEDKRAQEEQDLRAKLEAEMEAAWQQIDFMRKRLEELLAQQRGKLSGIMLEINEKIIEACKELMMAIRKLIERSKYLQAEIAKEKSQGGSTQQFYKKHHRWTEGLISAAKAVGWSANYLFECANKILKVSAEVGPDGKRQKPKLEMLATCSTEISASTTQLVMASRVQANPGSDNLRQLLDAANEIRHATANVLAVTRACTELIEEGDTMDFTKLTLHQAKRLEMETQAHCSTLEQDLVRERKRLGDLRRVHYQLAGESEGWELLSEPTAATAAAAVSSEPKPHTAAFEKRQPPPVEPRPKSSFGATAAAPGDASITNPFATTTASAPTQLLKKGSPPPVPSNKPRPMSQFEPSQSPSKNANGSTNLLDF